MVCLLCRSSQSVPAFWPGQDTRSSQDQPGPPRPTAIKIIIGTGEATLTAIGAPPRARWFPLGSLGGMQRAMPGLLISSRCLAPTRPPWPLHGRLNDPCSQYCLAPPPREGGEEKTVARNINVGLLSPKKRKKSFSRGEGPRARGRSTTRATIEVVVWARPRVLAMRPWADLLPRG